MTTTEKPQGGLDLGVESLQVNNLSFSLIAFHLNLCCVFGMGGEMHGM